MTPVVIDGVLWARTYVIPAPPKNERQPGVCPVCCVKYAESVNGVKCQVVDAWREDDQTILNVACTRGPWTI